MCFIEVGLSNLVFQMIWIDSIGRENFSAGTGYPPSPLQQQHLTTRAQFCFTPKIYRCDALQTACLLRIAIPYKKGCQ